MKKIFLFGACGFAAVLLCVLTIKYRGIKKLSWEVTGDGTENRSSKIAMESSTNVAPAKGASNLSTDWQMRWDDYSESSEGNLKLFVGGVGQLAEDGFTNEVFAKVLQEYGPGSDRNMLLAEIFRRTDLSFDELGSFIQRLEFKDEKNAMLHGLVTKAAYVSSVSEIHPSKFQFIADEVGNNATRKFLKSAYSSFIAAMPDGKFDTSRVEKRLESTISLLEGTENEVLISEIIGGVVAIAPESAFDLLLNHDYKITYKEYGRLFSGLFVVKSPASVLESLSAAGNLDMRISAFDYWLEKDVNAAMAWHNDNSVENLDESLAKFATKHNDFEAARQWVSRIEDPEVKKRIEGQMWQKENKLVSQAAMENSRKVVLEMANGNSEFDPLFLPTALNAWMKEDAEAAAQWVEREGVNLPPETRQFVAIAYAREAASQGNIELADQWAALIVDEDRKARVVKVIDGKRE